MAAKLEEALGNHVRVLCQEIGPRSVLEGDGLDRARDYVAASFTEAGFEVEEQAYDYRGRRVANLIARPPGQGGGDTVIIGAHYDTVPASPGADDNASAVAVLLETARRLVRPPCPLTFIAFTLEEPPAHTSRWQGSRAYLRAIGRQGRRAVKAAIVLEMVGFTAPRQNYPWAVRWLGYPAEGNFIGLIGDGRSRALVRSVEQGFRKNPGLPVETLCVPLRGWLLPATRLSDHASFWDRGIPALMVCDTAFFRNPHYHLPSDRPETLDFEFMAELVRSLELAVAELA
ncbi:MAG TPA: M28 family peptidase [Alphaproteobacteria bacterium]|nr:M28 family peptidase [Alphaproteobacteria bacterium]MDP6269643.1 M28 family peptidase [Alphaproteobacteria bacterium]MDP7428338.1 M28 family peptidase [Alphaproteobacteria bacterium]HJM50326.1 M28 family peptidase [Alphaproteobacteria bacterium]